MIKTLAAVLLLSVSGLGVPVSRAPQALRTPTDKVTRVARKGGRWYFTATGHAVYCYGPVTYINQGSGLQRVATFCQGDKPIVPLKD